MPHVHAHSWRVLSRALRLLGLALGLPLVLLGLPLVLLGRPHGLPRVPLLLLPRLPLLPRRHLLLRIPAGLAVDAREYLAEGGDGAVGCSERVAVGGRYVVTLTASGAHMSTPLRGRRAHAVRPLAARAALAALVPLLGRVTAFGARQAGVAAQAVN